MRETSWELPIIFMTNNSFSKINCGSSSVIPFKLWVFDMIEREESLARDLHSRSGIRHFWCYASSKLRSVSPQQCSVLNSSLSADHSPLKSVFNSQLKNAKDHDHSHAQKVTAMYFHDWLGDRLWLNLIDHQVDGTIQWDQHFHGDMKKPYIPSIQFSFLQKVDLLLKNSNEMNAQTTYISRDPSLISHLLLNLTI
jgi:hypothetical protein